MSRVRLLFEQLYLCLFHFSSDVFKAAKLFAKHLVDADFTLGTRDYYVTMLIFDILCFFTIIFGVNSFGVSVSTLSCGCGLMVGVVFLWVWFDGGHTGWGA